MKAHFLLLILPLLLFFATPAFALWEIAEVTKDQAKELKIEVRSSPAGPNDVRVELEFKPAGQLKEYDRVELHLGTGDKDLVAPLKEEKSKDGNVVVSFSADHARLDQIRLWIMVPGVLGGYVYELRAKDFVEIAKPDSSGK